MEPVPINKVIEILKKEVAQYNVPVVDLVKVQTNDPFKILIATILSARTQDKTTVKVLPGLFEKVNNIDDLKNISQKEIEGLIHPIGFYRNKARFLKQLPEVLEKEFNGKIPHDIDDLTRLPGVGRKTANLVRAVAFQKPAICVDTHVHKIMNRLGYVKTKTPYQTEMALRKKLPKRHWIVVNKILVAFGQNVCVPVSPKCSICPVYQYCNRVGVVKSR